MALKTWYLHIRGLMWRVLAHLGVGPPRTTSFTVLISPAVSDGDGTGAAW